MSMHRREALGILGALVPTTATLVAGCPAGEPPDIARGEAGHPYGRLVRHDLMMDLSRGFCREYREFEDGWRVFNVDARFGDRVDAMWPAGVVPNVGWGVSPKGKWWHLRVDWTAADGPWIGRTLRSDRGCVEELVGNEWLPVGRLAGEP